MQLLLPVAVLLALWFVMLRPQRARIRAHRSLVDQLAIGDEVLTQGGLIGRVVSIDAGEVGLEVAPATVLRVARLAVVGLAAPRDAISAAPETDAPVAGIDTHAAPDRHDAHEETA